MRGLSDCGIERDRRLYRLNTRVTSVAAKDGVNGIENGDVNDGHGATSAAGSELLAKGPDLAGRYRRAYARQSSAPREYAAALARRIKQLQRRFGFPANDGMRDRYARRRPPIQGALEL